MKFTSFCSFISHLYKYMFTVFAVCVTWCLIMLTEKCDDDDDEGEKWKEIACGKVYNSVGGVKSLTQLNHIERFKKIILTERRERERAFVDFYFQLCTSTRSRSTERFFLPFLVSTNILKFSLSSIRLMSAMFMEANNEKRDRRVKKMWKRSNPLEKWIF